ncbi:MAG: helix-turn-helix transcriptional regulator [Clostridiales bacterium]|nr:helix-turn-helix transcriptional regulator [Clostridiales bacterium]
MLNQSAATFDRLFESSDENILSLAVDPNIKSASYLTRPEFASKSIMLFRPLINRIKESSLSSPINHQTILFLKRPDAIVRQSAVTFDIRLFYESFMKYEGMSFEEWRDEVLSKPLSRAVLPSASVASATSQSLFAKKEYISYIHSFSLLTAVVLIDSESARDILSDNIISERGAALIVDRERNIVLDTGDRDILSALTAADLDRLVFEGAEATADADGDFARQRILGVDMVVQSRKSVCADLWYVSVNPANAALSDVAYVQRATTIGLILILTIGFGISLMFSRRYTRPIFELIDTNNGLNKAMQDQLVMSRFLFFGQLLDGTIRDMDVLGQSLSHFQIDLEGDAYFVARMTYRSQYENELSGTDGILEYDVFKIAVDKALNDSKSFKGFSYLMENRDIALIVCLSDGTTGPHKTNGAAGAAERQREPVVAEFIGMLRREMESRYQIVPKIGVGLIYKRLIDVNYSCAEAGLALERALKIGGQATVYYSQLDRRAKSGYYYPPDMEQRLIDLTKTGKKEEVLRNLHQIYKENFTNRVLEGHVSRRLFFEMESTLQKILGDADLGAGADPGADAGLSVPSLREIETEPEYEVIRSFTRAYVDICDLIHKNKKSHSKQLIDDILDEIRGGYSDSGMSLEFLASKYHISLAYFSRLFKEQTGVPFSAYLENIRIQKARELLRGTGLSVDKIAAAVGYNSAYSFRRAFKKITNTLPMEYRK